VGDFSAVSSVVHKEELDIVEVGDKELLESGGEEVSGLLVVSVSDGGHGQGSGESSSNSSVDTSGLSP